MEPNFSALVAIFPPEDAFFRARQPLSRWREFSFALHQVQHAIEPHLSLKHTLLNWNGIARALAENPRVRLLQCSTFKPEEIQDWRSVSVRQLPHVLPRASVPGR